ncbi:cystatin [Carassius auratus]|uniref:Cystatin n=1 Tax=Carassius auratus TaxID=7957 RepID=A0A6P6Q353_CARAU|nr:cystatin-like [Carassius auratus]
MHVLRIVKLIWRSIKLVLIICILQRKQFCTTSSDNQPMTEVVAGTSYIFTVKIDITYCKKGGVKTMCATPKDPSAAKAIQCDITVLSQPWLKSLKVTKNTCM